MTDPRPAKRADHDSDASPRTDRRHKHTVGGSARNPRNDVQRYITRHRLEPFHRALWTLAVAVFGDEATVVPHIRTVSGRKRLTFVVDAADPSASMDYEHFLPRERAFWTAYAHVPKPEIPFLVAVRPARGWCRLEALAPMFAFMPTGDLEA
ncbi:hypothetical protein J421_2987 [Gemmatirosa kalamazoonensis]|jgi:hypothetical protein|uniref:Uncharacterized protein n=1 Tax=Gemmatirosa kalamazoonensis TaxID=861299 RepID=W0RHC2_9BACT|nr:hypothetical protein [Gemmatirosa kalamazoonensis]AHG90524.1 hypothetical protein J421_2987 [Gemmatirosa kalamazoonensis]